jgi:glycosyltransferase involved in cell wall biosynthesis
MIKVLYDEFDSNPSGISRYRNEIVNRISSNFNLIKITREKGNFSTYPFYISRNLKKYKPDIFWSPGFMPPAYSYKIPFIVTIHDLMHLKFYSFFHKKYYDWYLKNLYGKAHHIITVSQSSKHDIIKWSGISDSKITVGYPGLSDNFLHEAKSLEKINILDNYSPYFFYIGNRRKNKNIENMLKAFSLIKSDIELHMSGDMDKNIYSLLKKLNLEHKVKFLGKLTDKKIIDKYKNAIATVYVSLYEGFGFPNIESLACGTNVVTSNISSMPEVVGDFGIKVDPICIDSIHEGLFNAIIQYTNESTQNFSIREKRKQMALNYQWDSTAKLVTSIINSF